MTITIFGATGGIGSQAVIYALEKGFVVKAYVRNPKKLSIKHSNLSVIVGELNEYSKMRDAIKGCDAVVCCIGIPMQFYYTNKVSFEAHKRILSIMKEEKITRLIDWATPSASSPQDKLSPLTLFPKILASIFLPIAKSEIVKIAELIVKSDLDWTIVRFIAPTNDQIDNEPDVSFGNKPLSFKIARASIAKFMIDELENNNYIHSMPIIGRKLQIKNRPMNFVC